MAEITREEVQEIIKATLNTVYADPLKELKEVQEARMKEFKEGLIAMNLAKTLANKNEKGVNIAKFIKAIAATKGMQTEAERYAKKNYGADDEVTKALLAGDFAAGGAIVPPDFSNEIVEFLRPQSVIRRLNPIVTDLPNGSMTLPKMTGGSSASYVGEGDDIPETQPTFGDLKLVYKKLVALVPISNDLLRFGTSRGDTMIRDDLVSSLAQREDIAFLRDDGTQDTPKGLRHWAPAANVISANATINLANVTSDLASLILLLENADVRMLRPSWIFAPRTKQFLMTIRDGNGNYAFRDEMLRGTLWGFPFGVTTQVPTNLGGGSDESEIYLVDMADAVIGEAATLTIDASSEATYMSGASLVSAYSKDQTVIRAIAEHDFGMRHDASVAVLTAVKWAP